MLNFWGLYLYNVVCNLLDLPPRKIQVCAKKTWHFINKKLCALRMHQVSQLVDPSTRGKLAAARDEDEISQALESCVWSSRSPCLAHPDEPAGCKIPFEADIESWPSEENQTWNLWNPMEPTQPDVCFFLNAPGCATQDPCFKHEGSSLTVFNSCFDMNCESRRYPSYV